TLGCPARVCPECLGDGWVMTSVSSIEPEPPEPVPCPTCHPRLAEKRDFIFSPPTNKDEERAASLAVWLEHKELHS
ncbi:MAG: hypothetical protein ACRDGF_04140, partial [Chloroflexota bacterium]